MAKFVDNARNLNFTHSFVTLWYYINIQIFFYVICLWIIF
jgi:hypothetical protein